MYVYIPHKNSYIDTIYMYIYLTGFDLYAIISSCTYLNIGYIVYFLKNKYNEV